MTKKTGNLLLIGFLVGFFAIGYVAFQDALPEEKNERVYEQLKTYFPYTIKQRLGGFTIIYKITGDKEKPPASEFFKRIDELDKQWAVDHLRLNASNLEVLDKNKKVVGVIKLQSQSEINWVKTFFNK